MKKHLILAAMATVTLFTACSNEEEESLLQGEKQVTFTIGQTVTRTSTDASTGVTSFQENDEIAIYSDGLTTDMEGELFVVASDGGLDPKTEGASFIYDGENGASFYAYYPTTATGSTTNVSFTISPDQSANQAFGLSDFMTAKTAVDAATETAVELQFAHRLTLIKVELSSIDDVTEVLINNVKPTVIWTYNGDAVETSGTATIVKMGKNENVTDKVEYWAVIPAQELAAATKLFTITAGGKTYSYTPTNTITLTEGGAKRFKLAIGEDGTLVSLSTSMDATWGAESGDEEGNLTEEDTKNYLITPSAGLFSATNVPEEVTGFTASAISVNEKWYLVDGGNDGASAVYDETGQAIKLSGFQQWYNDMIVYRLDPEKIKASENKTFTLSFTAKTAAGNNKLYVAISRIEKFTYKTTVDGNNTTAFQFFKLDTSNFNKTVDVYNLTNNTFSCTVDFSTIHRTQGTDKATVYDTDGNEITGGITASSSEDSDLNDVVLLISGNSATSDIFINNITLVEKEVTE